MATSKLGRIIWRQVVAGLCAVVCAAQAGTIGEAGQTPSAPLADRDRPSRADGAGAPGWLSNVERTLIEKEYEASENGAGLQAPNRRHGFRTYFETAGIRMVDRTSPGSPELARVRVASIGRSEERAAIAAGTVSGPGQRVKISRPGGLGVEEHFVNSPEGLRQTLTIARRPAGAGDLEVIFEVATATVEPAADGVSLRAPGGRRLSMQRLPVTDAAGRLLASRLEAFGDSRVRLRVEDAEAQFPLQLDNIFGGLSKSSLQGDQDGAQFGVSIDGAGDVNGDGYADVVVGASFYDSGENDEGAAFVFLGSAAGIVSGGAAGAATTLQGNQASARFGGDVAGAGDVNGDGYSDVVVGSFGYDSGEANEGAAFVFLGSASGIASSGPASASATLQGNQISSQFGVSVAGAGDVNGDGYADVLVGANLYDAPESAEGAAFVFLGSAAGVASGGPAAAAAVLQGNQTDAVFGFSVAGAGDVNGDGFADVVVGAYLYDSGQANEGAAFIFLGSASGIVSGGPADAAATLQGDQVGSEFGHGVAGAGDLNGDGYSDVLVGAWRYDAGQTDDGAVFEYHGSAAGISSGGPGSAATMLDWNVPDARFGTAVAAAGDVNGDGYGDAMVAAQNRGPYIIPGSPTGLVTGPSEIGSLLEGVLNGSSTSVAGAGDVNGDGYADILVGAPFDDSGQPDEGIAYVFLGSAAGVGNIRSGEALVKATWQGDQGDALFGTSVAGAGDVNGDGFADVIVGARNYDSGEAGEGAAFVFLGSASGIASGGPASAAATLQGNQPGAQLGISVAGAGDVNGDGYGDVVVGSYAYDALESFAGAAFVFLGGASGIVSGGPANAAATLYGDQNGSAFGWSVAGAGDVNGDGFADVLVGADLYSAGEAEEGAVFVFLGSPSGIASGSAASAMARLEANQAASAFGASVAGAGDVNGDGYADVVVGAYNYNSGQNSEGVAFVYLGSSAGLPSGGPAVAAATLQGNQADAQFGVSVAGAGDVNGDGYADVVIGAFVYDLGESAEGAAFVFLGGAAGIASGGPATAATTLEGDQEGAAFGSSVAGAGDVNGDGFADIVVGAEEYEFGETNEGTAFVFLGSAAGIASGPVAVSSARVSSNQVNAFLGRSVAGAGDVNGDGYSDVVVAAPLFGTGGNDEQGKVLLLLGNEGGGRPVLARQFQAGSPTPVEPWGSSLGMSSFDVRMSCYHPLGTGRVKLEVEACPAGRDFGGSGCVSAVSPAWSDATATASLTLSQPVAGLTASRLYHWRARTLYAPATVTQTGITAPPKPAHGPWRRFSGQAREADIRTLGGVFYSLAPCRVVDTRPGSGAPIGGPVMTSGIERMLPLVNKCGIPVTARAISVNLTAVGPTGTGALVLYPTAGAPTPTSNLSFKGGLSRANNSMLGLNRLGQMQVLAVVSNPAGADEVHLVMDVNGWFE